MITKKGTKMEKRYKIGEFAKKTGVSVWTVRSWDRKGILVASRTIAGHRYYTDEDLEMVRKGGAK